MSNVDDYQHESKHDSVDSKAADIDVRFETGFHEDSEPFDGSGPILGKWTI